MRALRLVDFAWLRRCLQACTDDQSVPIDQRPTVRLKNIRTRQYRSQLPNCYFMQTDGRTIVLVYGELFVEHEFDDPSVLSEEIRALRASGVKKVDILLGLLKVFIFIALFVVLLKVFSVFVELI